MDNSNVGCLEPLARLKIACPHPVFINPLCQLLFGYFRYPFGYSRQQTSLCFPYFAAPGRQAPLRSGTRCQSRGSRLQGRLSVLYPAPASWPWGWITRQPAVRVLTPSDTCKGQRPSACSVRFAVDVVYCYLGTDCAQSALVISQFLAVYTQNRSLQASPFRIHFRRLIWTSKHWSKQNYENLIFGKYFEIYIFFRGKVIYLCRELKLCIVFKNLHIRK